jgi:amino acid adenylation domain-containing protein
MMGVGCVRNWPDLFEAQVAATPAHTAVAQGNSEINYTELNTRSNRLAHAMIARGIGPERIVALALPRSIELVAAILAVLKTGAAYLPLDPNYPAAPLAQMLERADPALLLTTAAVECPPSTQPPRLILDDPATVTGLAELPSTDPTDADRITALRPAHPAYVIFTSGSTGAPKAVVVSHSGLPGLAASLIDRLAIGPRSRVLQSAAINFDAAVSDLCMALLSGAALVLPTEGELMPGAGLRALIDRHQVTHVALTPSALAMLDEGSLPRPVTLVVFGEACPRELVTTWATRHRMINAYGPTETTACVTLSESLVPHRNPPIGRPIGDNHCYVLDDELRLVPERTVGEVYVAGLGLALGYLGAPRLTAERFVACPFGPPGQRMYRTGDLARWNSAGELEFVGRVDDQAQIWGQRIEPAEVEAALREHPEVAQAAARVREDQPGNRRLVAYVVPREPDGSSTRRLPDRLRGFLWERLPGHLLPSAYVTLASLPLTRNGKLDRAALPAPDFTTAVTNTPPATAHEQVLAELFAEVLDLPRVGATDNFFSVGGTLVLASRLAARIRLSFNVELSVSELCYTPTVTDLAASLKERLDAS